MSECWRGWPEKGEQAAVTKTTDGGCLHCAWAEAEEVLPEGYVLSLHPGKDKYSAQAVNRAMFHAHAGPTILTGAAGDAPVTALRALAAKLRERTP